MPTNKQKAAAKKILENTGMPISKAMAEVGYKPGSVANPQQLTESKGWQELMNKYLPDDKVLETHKAVLEANKVISAKILSDANGQTDDFIEVPDHPTRLKAVELAYKVKKHLDNNPLNQFNIDKIEIINYAKE